MPKQKKDSQFSLNELTRELENSGLMNTYRENAVKLQPSYFFNPWGIHGVLHAKRVLFLSLILAHINKLSLDDVNVLVQASLYHDIGRTGDGVCYEHGRNSFRKMTSQGLVKMVGLEDEGILQFVVENHCIKDAAAIKGISNYRLSNHDRAIHLFKLFKDCDNLDRVRLGDLDVRHLRNQHSPGLVKVAGQLLVELR